MLSSKNDDDDSRRNTEIDDWDQRFPIVEQDMLWDYFGNKFFLSSYPDYYINLFYSKSGC